MQQLRSLAVSASIPARLIAVALLLIASLAMPTCPGAEPIMTGAGAGGGPHVRVFDMTGAMTFAAVPPGFFAFDPTFTGGVRVAIGDVTGDGIPDVIVGAGAGGGPHVKVFDGGTGAEVHSFFAYDPAFGGGSSWRPETSTVTAGPTSSPAPAPAAGPTSRPSTVRPARSS